MSEILLVNPKARTKSRKRRSPAQKRATAKLVAANKRRRRAPSRQLALATPRRRKRRGSIAANRRTKITRRRYARNPIGKQLLSPLTDALLLAAGAVGIHVGYRYLAPMLPLNIRQMPFAPAGIKAAAALGIGSLLLPMLMTRVRAQQITAGAIAAVITGQAMQQLFAPAAAPDGVGMWLDDPSLGYVYDEPLPLPDYSQYPQDADDVAALPDYTDQPETPDYYAQPSYDSAALSY